MQLQTADGPLRSDPVRGWLMACFLAYQLKWITEPSMFAIANKSRQIGFSDATAGGAVLGGCIERRPQLVLSASQDLADEVIEKARLHCKSLARLGVPQATNFTVDNKTELRWAHGGRIMALPGNPRTARSFSGDVWLDEFAYHQDPEGIRDGAFPMASRGGWRVRILSTPNGAQGLFHEWATDPPLGWAFHQVSVDDAIADGFDVSFEKLWQLCGGDERLFAQWYRCKFLDANLQYIPTAWADRALKWQGVEPWKAEADDRGNRPRERIYAGLDVARNEDLTALLVLAVVERQRIADGKLVKDKVAYVKETITCKRTDFSGQKQMIRDARARHRWLNLHVDSTGMGTQIAEEMVDEWGSEVVPVSFTNQSKEADATRALRWFRDDLVRFSRDDEGKALHGETVALRRMVTPAGNIVFEVPRTRLGHGDRWWAFALALRGAGEPTAGTFSSAFMDY